MEAGFAIVHPPDERYNGGLSLPGGIPAHEWDPFHSIVLTDEISRYVSCFPLVCENLSALTITRVGYTGVLWGLNAGNSIGCPPVMNFGSEKQKQYYLPKVVCSSIRPVLH